jgi:hypothetical protein
MATRLKMSRATLYRRMEEGLPYLKIGGVRRFDELEVLIWLQTQGRQAGAGETILPVGDYRCACGWEGHLPEPRRVSRMRCPQCGAVGKVQAV